MGDLRVSANGRAILQYILGK